MIESMLGGNASCSMQPEEEGGGGEGWGTWAGGWGGGGECRGRGRGGRCRPDKMLTPVMVFEGKGNMRQSHH